MRRFALGTVVLLLLVLAMPAGAAPRNQNTTGVDLSCDQPLGDLTVTIVENSSGVAAFTEDGSVLVIKQGTFEGTITIDVEGAPLIGPFPDGFELASAQGGGFTDQLIDCTGVYTFEDTFEVKKRDLAFLELGDEFLGATATVSGSFDFELRVLAPDS